MPLQLFNTLSAKVEEFHPLEDNLVRMYACGPTVYDYGHIGNFRTFIVVDTLRRFLLQSDYKLKHVMNITDVDDKIIRNAARDGVSVQEYTRKYKQAFLEDADALNIERPEFLVSATDHIQEMAHFIKGLEEKGFAYRTEDGSYYFRIAKFPEYGKLSKKDFAGMTDGARVDVDEYDKDNARDFALWKAPKPGEAFWETEIGPGRPGWHIECSAHVDEVSRRELRHPSRRRRPHLPAPRKRDRAIGGDDRQTLRARSGCMRVSCWSKARRCPRALGNFYTVRDLILMGHKPSSIRFLLMSVPYRKQLNFTFDGLTQAANSVERLRNFKRRLETSQFADDNNVIIAEIAERTSAEMRAGLDDDLNTARALGAIFDMVRDVNAAADAGEVRAANVPRLLEVLRQFDEIFAVLKDDDAAKVRATVEWAKQEGLEDKISPETAELAKAAALSDADIERLVTEHSQARKARDFARSDAIRAQLAEQGILLENTKDGVRWRRK